MRETRTCYGSCVTGEAPDVRRVSVACNSRWHPVATLLTRIHRSSRHVHACVGARHVMDRTGIELDGEGGLEPPSITSVSCSLELATRALHTDYLKGVPAPISNQRRWQATARRDIVAAGHMVLDVVTLLESEREQRSRNRGTRGNRHAGQRSDENIRYAPSIADGGPISLVDNRWRVAASATEHQST